MTEKATHFHKRYLRRGNKGVSRLGVNRL
jgi:hypothetical protein